jgi:hypothetical protein
VNGAVTTASTVLMLMIIIIVTIKGEPIGLQDLDLAAPRQSLARR